MMNEKLHSSLGRVCGICLILIVLGSLAAWQLYGVFTKKSEIHGTSKVIDYIDEENNIILNEDETIFFSYAFTEFLFENKDNVYSQKLILEKLKYAPEEKDYDVYVNANKALVVKEPGRVSATFPFSFQTGGADKYQALLNIVVTFFNDRTELTLSFTDKKLSGYLNQMAKMGFVIKITEKPSEAKDEGSFEDRPEDAFLYKYLVSDGFKNAGSWIYRYDNTRYPHNTYLEFAPTYSWSVVDKCSISEGDRVGFCGKMNGFDIKFGKDSIIPGVIKRHGNKPELRLDSDYAIAGDIFVGSLSFRACWFGLSKDIESNMLNITLVPMVEFDQSGEWAFKSWWEKNFNKQFVEIVNIQLYVQKYRAVAEPA